LQQPESMRSRSRNKSRGANPAYRDTTCAPCEDFYRYANGGWMSKVVLQKGEDSRGTLDEMNDRAQSVLHSILDSLASAPLPAGSPEWKVGRFYSSCMDSARADREGITPARAELNRISGISSRKPMMNRPEFAAAFGCSAGQAMVRGEGGPIRFW